MDARERAESRANRVPCEACDTATKHRAAPDGVSCPRLIAVAEIKAAERAAVEARDVEWQRACGVARSLIAHKPERPEDFVNEVRRLVREDMAKAARAAAFREAAEWHDHEFALVTAGMYDGERDEGRQEGEEDAHAESAAHFRALAEGDGGG